MVYLASPYSDPDPAVREARFRAAQQACAEMMREDIVVFSPIAHSHPIAERFDLPTDYPFWQAQCEGQVAACSAVVVLLLDGWGTSRGVNAEMNHAHRLGIPVSYRSPPAVTPA